MIRAYWRERLARAILSGNRVAFYIALDQLATVLSRERLW